MDRLVKAGWTPRNAAAMALHDSADVSSLPSPTEFVEAVAAGLAPGRREAVALAARLQAAPLPVVIEQWLMPMLHELGQA